jgi:hypothetical protein
MELTKLPIKILIFSAAGLAIFLWILVWLFGPQPERIQPDTQIPISLVGLTSEPVQKEEEPVKHLIPETWGRDPFETAYQAQAEASETSPEKDAKPRPQPERGGPQYRLSTILITGSNRLAVIDDRVYGEGDQIGGEKISKITLEHVVLTGDFGERLLEVPQPKTQVTVESTGGK